MQTKIADDFHQRVKQEMKEAKNILAKVAHKFDDKQFYFAVKYILIQNNIDANTEISESKRKEIFNDKTLLNAILEYHFAIFDEHINRQLNWINKNDVPTEDDDIYARQNFLERLRTIRNKKFVSHTAIKFKLKQITELSELIGRMEILRDHKTLNTLEVISSLLKLLCMSIFYPLYDDPVISNKWNMGNSFSTILFGKSLNNVHMEHLKAKSEQLEHIYTIIIECLKDVSKKDLIDGTFHCPEDVTEVEFYTFYGCSNLSHITLPKGVNKLGGYSFAGCTSLTHITLPEGLTQLGDGVFSFCTSLTHFTFPEGIKKLGNYTFSGCINLNHITLPKGVTEIGNDAFRNCTSLTHITLPEGMTKLGEYAFAGCTSLAHITLPEGITQLGRSAFSGCTNLTHITLPEGIKKIEDQAFLLCHQLQFIFIPGTNENKLEKIRNLLPEELKNKVVSKCLGSMVQWQLNVRELAPILGRDVAGVIYNKALSFFYSETKPVLIQKETAQSMFHNP